VGKLALHPSKSRADGRTPRDGGVGVAGPTACQRRRQRVRRDGQPVSARATIAPIIAASAGRSGPARSWYSGVTARNPASVSALVTSSAVSGCTLPRVSASGPVGQQVVGRRAPRHRPRAGSTAGSTRVQAGQQRRPDRSAGGDRREQARPRRDQGPGRPVRPRQRRSRRAHGVAGRPRQGTEGSTRGSCPPRSPRPLLRPSYRWPPGDRTPGMGCHPPTSVGHPPISVASTRSNSGDGVPSSDLGRPSPDLGRIHAIELRGWGAIFRPRSAIPRSRSHPRDSRPRPPRRRGGTSPGAAVRARRPGGARP
jgi:hypothetical protein